MRVPLCRRLSSVYSRLSARQLVGLEPAILSIVPNIGITTIGVGVQYAAGYKPLCDLSLELCPKKGKTPRAASRHD